jgi:hypothetical protein
MYAYFYNKIMPLKIPSEVRASVIRDWLNGKPRDTIAHDNLVSSGAVSNRKGDLTVYDADALRELGIMFRKSGITAPQCAIGFRLASILNDLGVDQEKFGDFVSQIYNQCMIDTFNRGRMSRCHCLPL